MSSAISPDCRPADEKDLNDLDDPSDGQRPAATAADADSEIMASPMPAIPEPEKFAALVTFIGKDLTIRSIEGQIGRMINAHVLADKNLWKTGNPWVTAKRALDKLKDPAQLAVYWRAVCFLRGRYLGNPRAESIMAASYAVLDVVGEMMDENKP